jgi:hypothetical protein
MAHNLVIDLMVAGHYESAAEWMMKLHRPDMLGWDKPRKENEVKHIATVLKTNHGKLHYLRGSGYSARAIAEKAFQQTVDDLSSKGWVEVKGLHELNDDEEQ